MVTEQELAEAAKLDFELDIETKSELDESQQPSASLNLIESVQMIEESDESDLNINDEFKQTIELTNKDKAEVVEESQSLDRKLTAQTIEVEQLIENFKKSFELDESQNENEALDELKLPSPLPLKDRLSDIYYNQNESKDNNSDGDVEKIEVIDLAKENSPKNINKASISIEENK